MEGTTTVTVGWFAGRTCKNTHTHTHTHTHIYIYIYIYIYIRTRVSCAILGYINYISDKCDCGPHNTTWQDAGRTPLMQWLAHPVSLVERDPRGLSRPSLLFSSKNIKGQYISHLPKDGSRDKSENFAYIAYAPDKGPCPMSGWYKVVSSSCSVPTTIMFAFLIAGLRAACPSYHTLDITTSVMLMLLFIRFTCPPTFSRSSSCLSFLHVVLPRFTPVTDDNVFLKTKITTSTDFHFCITAILLRRRILQCMSFVEKV